MYFKVDRKILKKVLVWLKLELEKDITARGVILNNYINKIKFALYKTKMNEFYIDFDFLKPGKVILQNKDKEKVKSHLEVMLEYLMYHIDNPIDLGRC